MTQPTRPLVETRIRTEFGDVLDDPSFYDVSGADRDLTFVPGFSDMRRARDLAQAEVAAGKIARHEAKIDPLPVNLYWVRTVKPSGAPDSTKQLDAGLAGYKVVHKDEIGKHEWLKSAPPGCTFDADGSIRKGDVVLMVVDGKRAARNAAVRAAKTRRLTDEVTASGGLLATKSRFVGTDAYVKKES